MIVKISKLVKGSNRALYRNFTTTDFASVKYDIVYNNVALLHFIYRDGSQAVLNLFLGEIDIMESNGEIIRTIDYPSIDDALRLILSRILKDES